MRGKRGATSARTREPMAPEARAAWLAAIQLEAMMCLPTAPALPLKEAETSVGAPLYGQLLDKRGLPFVGTYGVPDAKRNSRSMSWITRRPSAARSTGWCPPAGTDRACRQARGP